MAPIIGKAHIAYLPRNQVVGISKLARVLHGFARRLQVQERLTAEVADCIWDNLKPQGVAVVIEASHACMTARGVRTPGVTMITSRMMGVFRDDERSRKEVLALMGRGRADANRPGHRRGEAARRGDRRGGWRRTGMRVVDPPRIIRPTRPTALAAEIVDGRGRAAAMRATWPISARSATCSRRRARRSAGRSTGWSTARRCSSSTDRRPSIRRCSRELGAINLRRAGAAGVARWRRRTMSRTARWSMCSTRRSPTSTPISSPTAAARSRWRGRRRCWRRRSAPRIRVNAVSPGLTLPSGDQSEAEFARGGERQSAASARSAPRRSRDAVAFLLTAQGVTGQNVFVDCGQRFLPRDGDVMFERATHG